jgi:hypothetical protein
VSFGRPSVVNYYTTRLPQDRTEDDLSDAVGSDALPYTPQTEATDATYHAAYFQLTIPSFELLDRVFHMPRRMARSADSGWLTTGVRQEEEMTADSPNTYTDAIRLGRDIIDWYSKVPRGLRFEESDTAEVLVRTRGKKRINQTLALCVKSHMIV